MVDETSHNLTSRQIRAIPVILSCRTFADAASSLNISRETLHTWLRNPLFRAEYTRQSNELVDDALGNLKLLAQESVDVLRRLLRNKQPGIRFKASVAILEHVRIFREMELEDRIAKLEAKAGIKGGD